MTVTMRRDANLGSEPRRDEDARSRLVNKLERWGGWCRRGGMPKLGHQGIAPEQKAAFGAQGRVDDDDLMAVAIEKLVLDLFALDADKAEALRLQYVYRGSPQEKSAKLGCSVSKFYEHLEGGRLFMMGRGIHNDG